MVHLVLDIARLFAASPFTSALRHLTGPGEFWSEDDFCDVVLSSDSAEPRACRVICHQWPLLWNSYDWLVSIVSLAMGTPWDTMGQQSHSY